MRVDKWRGQVEQAKAGGKGQDQEQCSAVAARRRPLRLK
jgi:hypothetical protein